MGLTAKEIQQMLTELRYYRGAINGDLRNDVFRDALKKFQSDKRLTVDGWYGAECETALQKYLQAMAVAGIKLADTRLWRITHYIIAEETEHPSGSEIPFVDTSFKTLAKGSPSFFCDASLQGTGKLRDGTLLNVAGAKPVAKGDKRWDAVLAMSKKKFPGHIPYGGVRTDASESVVTQVMTWNKVTNVGVGYGVGKKSVPYTPFKTVASDIGAYGTSEPRYKGAGGLVPSGTKILMIDLIGNKMPDGTIHDGWVIANDTGGAIFGAHFDLFTGTKAMAAKFKKPDMGHIWFQGITERVKPNYTWGLTTI